MQVRERSIVTCIILSFVTCGIYGLYWLYSIQEDTNALTGEYKTSGGMVIVLSIVTCGIYLLYWMYKQGERLNMAKQSRGLAVDPNAGIIYLILTLFELGIVSYCLMQSEINKLVKA